ncbi:MAG: YitT family protein [Clostridia bacterium]|nr:YitT family protein [Clostridia bacterium]
MKTASLKKVFQNDLKRVVLIALGSALFAFNVNTFVHAAGLFPGGIAGTTLLLQAVFQRFMGLYMPYSVINLILNAIPIYIGFRFIGKKFTALSCLSIVLTSVLTDLMQGLPITSEPILVSIFGGILNGSAISLCLLAGGTSGGTDFISIWLSEQHGRDSFNMILGFNVVMLSVAGLLFGWERALYSIIFQYASTQVLHTLYRNYQQQTLLIITEHPEEVYSVINDATHHGATLFRGTGLYEHQERMMVYSVVDSDAVKRVTQAVRNVDGHAFINSIKTNSLTGRFYRRPKD